MNNKRNMQFLLPLTIYVNEIPWGWPFLVVFTLCTAGYVGGGAAVGFRRGQGGVPAAKGVGVLAVHPHFKLWGEVVALCVDGALFVSARAGSRHSGRGGIGGGYSSLRETAPAGAAVAGKVKAEKKEKRATSSERSSGKKEKKGRSKEREKDGKESSPPEVPAPEPEPGTASAGGGRWVHIPS